ncbi:MAG: phosphatase PAP2 family protein [Capnocytophaga sp.]|nr:phosphatase PAP2 family protein [Capnocytophaga sp.]
MNQTIAANFARVKPYFLIFPLLVMVGVFCFLYTQDALQPEKYALIQKDCFFYLNAKLSQLPDLQYNLTQFGDAFVVLCLLSVLLVYFPKIWENLLSASLLSLLFSRSLKEYFDIPRPATIYPTDTFSIIGKEAVGFSSFPSGHSITVFTTLGVLLIAFLPKSLIKRCLYVIFLIVLGLILAFTRVAVGAHHPLDVISGSAIGCISAFLGILINQKYNIWQWISNKKYYPIFIVLFLGCAIIMIYKVLEENVFVYYLSLLSLVVSLFLITKAYVQKINK